MKIVANSKKANIEIILVQDKKLPKTLNQAQKDALHLRNYKGEGHCLVGDQLFVGVEHCAYPFPNALRDALAGAITYLKKLNITNASICVENPQEAKEVCEGILLGHYTFDTFKSTKAL